MADQGTSFTIDIPVKGAGALEQAAKALTAFERAMAEQKDRYTQAEKASAAATRGVEKLTVALELQRNKLAAAREIGNEKAVERAEKAISELGKRYVEASIKAEKFKADLAKEAEGVDKVTKHYEKWKKAKEDAEKAAAAAGPPGALAKLQHIFGESRTATIGYSLAALGLAAALVAVAAAIAAVIVKTAAWAVGLADARRQQSLLAQGWVQSIKGGEQLNADLRGIAKTLPATQEELGSLAQGFAYAGYRGKDLANAVRTAALWSARLKFGPDFQKEMLSLDQQSKILQLNISNLFCGLKIEGLLGALQKMIALLDDSTESGRAIKVVFESFFQPLIDGVVDAQYKIEAFFLQLEIYSLKALISLKQHWSTVKETLLVLALVVGGVLVAAFGAVAVAIIAATWPILAIGAAIGLAVYGIYKLSQWLSSFDGASVAENFLSIGKAIIDGIVNGLLLGGPQILSTLKGAVMTAVDGVKNLLGIHSPSTVMQAEVGYQMGAGVREGVEDATPGVRNSLESMVAPPSAPVAAGAVASAAAPSARSGASVTGNTFVFQGVQGAEDAEVRFSALLTRLLEGDVAQLGAAAPVTT